MLFKFIVLIFLFFQAFLCFSQDCLVHTGTYQGKNVYVQNPFAINGIGFSTKKVTVNGEAITNDFVSSAFEIDLKKLNLEIGDSVNVKIYFDEGCEPRIIDRLSLTSALKPSFESIKIDTTGVLQWCTINESSEKTFFIEQYKWNKWVVVGQVLGLGATDKNCYEFQVDFHSGENTFRIIQENLYYSKHEEVLQTINIKSPIKKVVVLSTKGNKIHFSNSTHYEVYDTFGNIRLKGFSSEPKLGMLEKGLYYINYDNTTGDVFNLGNI